MKVVAVGDIGIHGRHADSANRDPESLAAPTRPLFTGAHLVLANLEIPICEGAQHAAPAAGRDGIAVPATGAAPASAARLLRSWGFTHLSLANNHIMDLGVAGLEETIALLRAEGIVPFGAGRNEQEAALPVRIDGGDVPAALLGYSMRCRANARDGKAGSAPFRFGAAVETIRSLVAEGRQVIVQLHMGRMYLRRPAPQHLRVVRGLMRAGAALVLCHHAHVPAGIVCASRRCAALGLGDFLFDAYQGEIRTIVGRRSRTVGVCLRAELVRDGVAHQDAVPLLLPATGGPILHPQPARIMQQWRGWDRELRLPLRAYAGVYYLLEYPRLLVYIGHAASIHACRRNWRKVYDYTLGLVLGRWTRNRRGADSES